MNAQQPPFTELLDAVVAETETVLERALASQPLAGETMRPARLIEAMRHAALGGGKRLRPFLLVESASLFDVPRERALMAGAALECVHCYSLTHDDLPAMDNDDMRRGRPTVHKAFGDATAILAGDALLTAAFDILASDETHPDPAIRIALVSEMARAAGIGGMAGGQMLDLEAEGRFGARKLGERETLTLQAMKTGALIRFACRAGAILGGADAAQLRALDAYGVALGAAFQVADDLLDVEGDAATLGKQTGKDAQANKATLVAALGAEGARRKLVALVTDAEAALAPFGNRASRLLAAARFIHERKT